MFLRFKVEKTRKVSKKDRITSEQKIEVNHDR